MSRGGSRAGYAQSIKHTAELAIEHAMGLSMTHHKILRINPSSMVIVMLDGIHDMHVCVSEIPFETTNILGAQSSLY